MRNVASDLDDAPRCFMAVDGGQISTPTTVEEGDVAVADGDCVDLDANLSRLRGTKGEVLDHEWLSERAQHCCLDHGHLDGLLNGRTPAL
jgi:hypothetical protein